MSLHRQQFIAIIALAILLYFIAGLRNALLFSTGIGLGVLFVYGSIGFTSAWRTLITKGNPFAFYGQTILLFVGVLVFMPIYQSFPTLTRVTAPLSYSSFIGAFMFGIGMQLGDGCGSGTLAKLSYNQFSKILILPFLFGSFLGTIHIRQFINYGGISKTPLVLSEHMPLAHAIAIQLSLLLFVALLAWLWKRYKKNNDKFAWAHYKKLYLSMLGVIVLAVLFLLLSGRGWGISFALGLWGTKIVKWLGINVTDIPYWTDQARTLALSQSIIFDSISLTNIGLILGAWYFSSRRKLKEIKCTNKKNVCGAVLGGLLMGYGAQLAFGCNIGPYFSGIVSGSMHGWTWFLFAFLGSAVGIPLRRLLVYNSAVCVEDGQPPVSAIGNVNGSTTGGAGSVGPTGGAGTTMVGKF